MSGKNIRDSLLDETGIIPWQDLQRFYAQGRILLINTDLDFQAVALALAEDNSAQVKGWLDEELIQKPDDTQAKDWLDREVELRALVTAPWVLIQVL